MNRATWCYFAGWSQFNLSLASRDERPRHISEVDMIPSRINKCINEYVPYTHKQPCYSISVYICGTNATQNVKHFVKMFDSLMANRYASRRAHTRFRTSNNRFGGYPLIKYGQKSIPHEMDGRNKKCVAANLRVIEKLLPLWYVAVTKKKCILGKYFIGTPEVSGSNLK